MLFQGWDQLRLREGRDHLKLSWEATKKPQHWIIGKKFAVILAVLSSLSGSALNPVLKAVSSHSPENLNLSDRT